MDDLHPIVDHALDALVPATVEVEGDVIHVFAMHDEAFDDLCAQLQSFLGTDELLDAFSDLLDAAEALEDDDEPLAAERLRAIAYSVEHEVQTLARGKLGGVGPNLYAFEGRRRDFTPVGSVPPMQGSFRGGMSMMIAIRSQGDWAI